MALKIMRFMHFTQFSDYKGTVQARDFIDGLIEHMFHIAHKRNTPLELPLTKACSNGFLPINEKKCLTSKNFNHFYQMMKMSRLSPPEDLTPTIAHAVAPVPSTKPQLLSIADSLDRTYPIKGKYNCTTEKLIYQLQFQHRKQERMRVRYVIAAATT
ncbi:hypothetical protein PR048_026008 [Dryococelus australis]|uniref:Uncharacterized protein n=1 Tax=Dryococelus australis TaxID=614101 RepID=A0ABQ9GK62_9NEOP|nr:hypothetical protein PR048_026008 [Dryococelus australis]